MQSTALRSALALALFGCALACGQIGGVDFDLARRAQNGEQSRIECAKRTCSDLEAACGLIDDGCGDPIDCGTCVAANTQCVLENTKTVCACVPKLCEEFGAECGTVPDGCGQTLACGACSDATKPYCSNGNKCSATPCTPKTQAQACAGGLCGVVSDGCGNTVTCGTCTNPQTCGGGGVENECGCKRKDVLTCPPGCIGTLIDNCGVATSTHCEGTVPAEPGPTSGGLEMQKIPISGTCATL